MAVIDLPPTVEAPTVGNRNRSTREPWVLVESPHPRGTTAGVLLSLLPGDSKSPHLSLPHGRQGVVGPRRGPHAQRCWQLLRREAGLRERPVVLMTPPRVTELPGPPGKATRSRLQAIVLASGFTSVVAPADRLIRHGYHPLLPCPGHVSLWKTEICISQTPLKLGFGWWLKFLWTDVCTRFKSGSEQYRLVEGWGPGWQRTGASGPGHYGQWGFHDNRVRWG